MIIFCDGSTTRYCFIPEEGEPARISNNPPNATHNESEYLAIIAAMIWYARTPKVLLSNIEICSDSQLAVNQINKVWEIKEPRLGMLAHIVWKLKEKIPAKFVWCPREDNLAGKVLEEK